MINDVRQAQAGLCRDDSRKTIGNLDRLGVENGVCWAQ